MKKTYKTLTSLNKYLIRNELPELNNTVEFFEQVVNNVLFTITLEDGIYTVEESKLSTSPVTTHIENGCTSAKIVSNPVLNEEEVKAEYAKIQASFKRDTFERFINAKSVKARENLKEKKEKVLEGAHLINKLNDNVSAYLNDDIRKKAVNITTYFIITSINKALLNCLKENDEHLELLTGDSARCLENNFKSFIDKMEVLGSADFKQVEDAYNELKKSLQFEKVNVNRAIAEFLYAGYGIKVEASAVFVKNMVGMLARNNYHIAGKMQLIKIINDIILFDDINNVPLKAMKKDVVNNYPHDDLVDLLEKADNYNCINYEVLCKVLHMKLSGDKEAKIIDNKVLMQRAKKAVAERAK